MAGWTTLVQADILSVALGRPDLVIVDCRFSLLDPNLGEQAWLGSHIPGAVYAHLERVLLASGFLNPSNPRHLMRRLRRLYLRADLSRREVRILRGILAESERMARLAGRAGAAP